MLVFTLLFFMNQLPYLIESYFESGYFERFVDASSVWLPDMGEIADLKD